MVAYAVVSPGAKTNTFVESQLGGFGSAAKAETMIKE